MTAPSFAIRWRSHADPRDFAVNKRHLNNTFRPRAVTEAMDNLRDEATLELARQHPGWRPHEKQHFMICLTFYMPSRRFDVDGPIKRVIDAVTKGLGIMDSRIEQLDIRRILTGKDQIPGIHIVVLPVDETHYRERHHDPH